ncbi:methyl-accepting chemotaxis protein [Spirochaeta africana]|uniref:Methyl-accepting chemotaxis protein n=1 Tax=Spirochaeta africana (strain ATCC 700263 / DSM 8902 / Z-7692) TaxID=889378 RepID=H9UMB6_SPIAZ|nr:methyl-accepting chemotaxis protein [Spirochaeta africana]AFG38659.1 methyl-accepting chemotaxis protein [Spirochaeta africana DSM 8902]
MRLALRSRMLLFFGGIIGGLLLVQSVLLVVQIRTVATEMVTESARNETRARAYELGRWIQGHINEAAVLANLPVVRSGDTDAIWELMLTRQDVLNPDHSHNVFVAADGQNYSSRGTSNNVFDREYFQAVSVRGNTVHVDQPIFSRSFNQSQFMVSHIVRDADRTVGQIVIAVTLNTLDEIVSSRSVTDNAINFVVNSEGLVVAHPNEEYPMELNLFESAEMGFSGLDTFARELVRVQEGIGTYRNEQGVPVTAFYTPIPNSPDWSLAVAIPNHEFYSSVRLITMTIVLLNVVVLLVAALSIYILAKRLTRPITSAVSLAGKFSLGDFSMDLSDGEYQQYVARNDEIGDLARSFGNLQSRLSEAVSSIKTSAGQVLHTGDNLREIGDDVSKGANEMSIISNQLSQGASEQAASVEQVSASMEQMLASIQQSSDNAQATEAIAVQSAGNAEKSGAAVAETVLAMRQIAEKITIIEDIARETNMLSLNAAIEAARAGEYGKGFAVVAAQVRKLAENSATAAKEISELSLSSVQVAEEAGVMLEEMVPNIKRTAELIQEIAASSREMNTGARQVNQAVAQLDTVVQQTASSAEEVSATAEQQTGQTENMADAAKLLLEQAEALEDVVAFFRLKTADISAPPSLQFQGAQDL